MGWVSGGCSPEEEKVGGMAKGGRTEGAVDLGALDAVFLSIRHAG